MLVLSLLMINNTTLLGNDLAIQDEILRGGAALELVPMITTHW